MAAAKMAAIEIEPRWIGSGTERRFAVLNRPRDGAVRGALVFVPPFAEEMNKSRRLVAQTARALAARGTAVLVIDLFGCGDSPGDLETASWPLWGDDVARAHAWLSAQTGAAADLWALRGGALLAAEALGSIGRVATLVLWQPVTTGKQQLTQFLRLKVAAQALGGDDGGASTADLMTQLQAGAAVDVAGYRLPAAVALPMAASALGAAPDAAQVHWLDVNATGETSPATRRVVDRWQAAGAAVNCAAVVGPPFWQTQELEDCPALVEATLRALA